MKMTFVYLSGEDRIRRFVNIRDAANAGKAVRRARQRILFGKLAASRHYRAV